MDLNALFPIGKSSLLSCSLCSLQFLSPLPDRESLNKIYEDYYSVWGIDQLDKEISAMKKKTFSSYLNYLKLPAERGAFLDVGCATGEMLALAREMGFDVYGVEVSPRGVSLCRKLFGEHKIKGKNIEYDDFPAGFFDVITLSDVLEHLTDPPEFIAMLSKMLKSNGLMLIVTPDTSSFTCRLLGKYWPHYKIEHLHYFNRFNLLKMCSSHFKLLTVTTPYKTLTLNYISNIINGYHRNMLARAIVQFIQWLPQRWRANHFKINTGEMLMLFKKIECS
ncbi:MAG: class I SAM-dependent methyltransferase [Nitrospirae bacterium]|nr:class I SAM-dependent methyltransferase [Nitrospirota bacterium]